MNDIPNPGSPEAIDKGCTCAVIDNHYGDGFGDPPMWYITGGCPLHWPDVSVKLVWPPKSA